MNRRQYTSYGPSAILTMIQMTVLLILFTIICGYPAFLCFAGYTAVGELNSWEKATQECHDDCVPNPGKVMNDRCFCVIGTEYVAP